MSIPSDAPPGAEVLFNSGVFLRDRYEIQVLDSHGIAAPGTGDRGAVYGQLAPLAGAARAEGSGSLRAVLRGPSLLGQRGRHHLSSTASTLTSHASSPRSGDFVSCTRNRVPSLNSAPYVSASIGRSVPKSTRCRSCMIATAVPC